MELPPGVRTAVCAGAWSGRTSILAKPAYCSLVSSLGCPDGKYYPLESVTMETRPQHLATNRPPTSTARPVGPDRIALLVGMAPLVRMHLVRKALLGKDRGDT